MADHLHPAIDIPGGLWEGAPVHTSRGLDLIVCDVWHGVIEAAGPGEVTEPYPPEEVALRLDDPLGLGLARLAGRVAERAGLDPRIATMDGLGDVAFRLAGQPWALPYWRRYLDSDDEGGAPRIIREAATLLARLDRLVAATWPDDGIVLAPGTVPDWRRDGAEWVLTVGPVGCARYAVDVLDPIEAAGTALEVRGG